MAEPLYSTAVSSKLERAVVAYLVQVGGLVGSKSDITTLFSTAKNKYPNTTVYVATETEDVADTGLGMLRLHISIKGSAVSEANEPNKDLPRFSADGRIGATRDAMAMSDDGRTLRYTCQAITDAGRALAVAVDDSDEAALLAKNNSDMTEFTCQTLHSAGAGMGEESVEGASWEKVLMFDIRASPSNVD